MTREMESSYDLQSVRLPDDVEAVLKIDRSFTTDTIYEVVSGADGFRLVPKKLSSPVTKEFPLSDLTPDDWDDAWIARIRGQPVGFLATRHETWHARLVIHHLYVDSSHRGKGVGRLLIEEAIAQGRRVGAGMLWAETSNLNHPGIEAYRAFGFEVCGLDLTHYRGTPSEGEIAIFLARGL